MDFLCLVKFPFSCLSDFPSIPCLLSFQLFPAHRHAQFLLDFQLSRFSSAFQLFLISKPFNFPVFPCLSCFPAFPKLLTYLFFSLFHLSSFSPFFIFPAFRLSCIYPAFPLSCFSPCISTLLIFCLFGFAAFLCLLDSRAVFSTMLPQVQVKMLKVRCRDPGLQTVRRRHTVGLAFTPRCVNSLRRSGSGVRHEY